MGKLDYNMFVFYIIQLHRINGFYAYSIVISLCIEKLFLLYLTRCILS